MYTDHIDACEIGALAMVTIRDGFTSLDSQRWVRHSYDVRRNAHEYVVYDGDETVSIARSLYKALQQAE